MRSKPEVSLRAVLLALLLPGPTLAATAEEREAQCLVWLGTGYPSGIEEGSCTADFDLPSPFLFRCARAIRLGFRDEAERAACLHFLERQTIRAAETPLRRDPG